MADVAGDASIASWIQAGGVLAFASVVLVWMRDWRRELGPVLIDLGKTLTEVKTTLAALLERERARAERLAAQDATRAAPESWEGELTGPLEMQRVKAQTPPRGLPYAQHNRPKTSGGG